MYIAKYNSTLFESRDDADKIMEAINKLADPAAPLFEAMQKSFTENTSESKQEGESADNVVDAEFTEVKDDDADQGSSK